MNTVRKITSVKRVRNGKLQAQMQDKVQKPGAVNVLAALNEGDEAFDNSGSLRYGWFAVTTIGLAKMGVDEEDIATISELEEGEQFDIEIENPSIEGEALRLRIVETTSPSKYDTENTLKQAKKLEITKVIAERDNIPTEFDLSNYIGEYGYFMTPDGYHVFSNTSVTTESQLKHVFLKDLQLVPESELQTIEVTLAPSELAEVEEKAKA
jgi:hypothetical protein